MRAKDGDAVDFAGKHVRGRRGTANVRSTRDRQAAVGALGAAQAKVRDRVALGRLHHAGGLGGNQRLEVHKVEKGRLDQLAVDDRAHNANHGLAREDNLALGHGVDREVQAVPAQELKEAGLEHGAAAGGLKRGQVLDVGILVDKVLDKVGNLTRAARDAVAPAKRVFAEEGVEAGLGLGQAALPKALGHRELVEIGVKTNVGWFGAVGQRHSYRLPKI